MLERGPDLTATLPLPQPGAATDLVGDLPADMPVARITAFQVDPAKESAFVEQSVFLMASMIQLPVVTAFTFHRAFDVDSTSVEYVLFENWESGDQFRAQRGAEQRRRFDDAIRDVLVAAPAEKLYWGCYGFSDHQRSHP